MVFVPVHVAYLCGLFEKHGKQMRFALDNAAYIQGCSLLPEMSFVSCLFTLIIFKIHPRSVECLAVLHPRASAQAAQAADVSGLFVRVRVSVFRICSRTLA